MLSEEYYNIHLPSRKTKEGFRFEKEKMFGNVVALFLYQSAADFEIFQKNILSLPCPILHVMIILWKDIIVDNV